jgi:hypothetical protein
MTNKTIIRISFIGVIAIVCLAFFLISFNAATPVPAKACSETMEECGQKKSASETGSGIDLETLSGKFFSSVSY